MMQNEPLVLFMRILVQMIDTVRIEQGCSTLYTVYDISFFEKKLGEIGAILAGNTGNKCDFRHR